MIELTPLDVRKKRGDFRKGMRGYDPGEVDSFIELVAERLETLVKENMTLKERSDRLSEQVKDKQDREKAVQEALVTAQALRKDISGQAEREAELLRREAEAEIERLLMEAENRLDEIRLSMDEMDRRRRRFLRALRAMLERELDFVGVEESRDPLADKPLELELFIPKTDEGAPEARPWDRAVPADKAGELLGADEEGLPVSSPQWTAPDTREPERVNEPAPPYVATPAAAPVAEPPVVETPVVEAPVVETPVAEAPAQSMEQGRAPDGANPATEGTEQRRWEPHWRFTLGEGGGTQETSE